MKLNQEFIQQLRNGEIAAHNNGTIEQLKEVLEEAFPESLLPIGAYKYYFLDETSGVSFDDWYCSDCTDMRAINISRFYEKELFTGWAKDDDNPKWIVYFKNDVAKFGFDAYGAWTKWGVNRYAYSEDPGNRPATNEEIETTLTKEAKRRGYKGGNTIKGIHGTTHWRPEIASFYYDAEYDRLLTNEGCVVYEAGQWAGIVEKPKPQPKKSTTINYLVDGMEYSFNYQELKFRYEDICQYSDEQFMEELPEIAHLACIVSYLKGLGAQATIGDKGIVHELLHLMTEPNEPTNDLQEIREKFNKLIKLS